MFSPLTKLLALSLFMFSSLFGCHEIPPDEKKETGNLTEAFPVEKKDDSGTERISNMAKVNSEELIKEAYARDKSCRQVFTGNKGSFSFPSLSYARVFGYSFLQDLCHEEGNGTFLNFLMNPAMSEKDALNVPQFNRGTNKDKSIDNVIATYALIYSLGRRESSGNFYQGRDLTASNTEALTEEAGLLQISANSLNLKGKTTESKNFLKALFQSYILSLSSMEKNDLSRECLSDVLGTKSETANFDSSGLKLHLLFKYGECDGLAQKVKDKKLIIDEKTAGCFRQMTKECPSFAIKYGLALSRIRRDHNGPLILHEEFPQGIDQKFLKPYLEPACHELFKSIVKNREGLCLK